MPILPQTPIIAQTAERAAAVISKLTGETWKIAGESAIAAERGKPFLEGAFGRGTPVYEAIEKHADAASVALAVKPNGNEVKLVLQEANLPVLERRAGIASAEGKTFTDRAAKKDFGI